MGFKSLDGSAGNPVPVPVRMALKSALGVPCGPARLRLAGSRAKTLPIHRPHAQPRLAMTLKGSSCQDPGRRASRQSRTIRRWRPSVPPTETDCRENGAIRLIVPRSTEIRRPPACYSLAGVGPDAYLQHVMEHLLHRWAVTPPSTRPHLRLLQSPATANSRRDDARAAPAATGMPSPPAAPFDACTGSSFTR